MKKVLFRSSILFLLAIAVLPQGVYGNEAEGPVANNQTVEIEQLIEPDDGVVPEEPQEQDKPIPTIPPVVGKDNLLTHTEFNKNFDWIWDWQTRYGYTEEYTLIEKGVSGNGKIQLSPTAVLQSAKNGINITSNSRTQCTYIGQKVLLQAGRQYEFSFNVRNSSTNFFSSPFIEYGIHGATKLTYGSRGTSKCFLAKKKMEFTPKESGEYTVFVGTRLENGNFFNRESTLQLVSPKLVDKGADTFPTVTVNQVKINDNQVIIQGVGLPFTKIHVINGKYTELTQVETDEQGNFGIIFEKGDERFVHLINRDNLGNSSESVVVNLTAE